MIPRIFWLCAVTAIIAWALQPGYVVGWDLNVYKLAAQSVRAGHDPYLECVAARQWFFSHMWLHPTSAPPYGYVYPPATLPILKAAATSLRAASVVYWCLFVLCSVVVLWAGTVAIEPREQKTFAFLLPAVVFFPGLLQYDCLFSGNVAYIIYGLVLLAAVRGWRTGHWMWIYPAIFAGSLAKPTFLALLAIPVLSARRQWMPAILTGVAGVLFVLWQMHHWPIEFHNYRLALDSQIVAYGHDFGFHPAGLISGALFDVLPYRLVSLVLYALFTLVFGSVLLHLRGKYLRGEVSLTRWIPVMLIGVTLLNPRIMEYDTPPVTVAMALVAWRFFEHLFRSRGAVIVSMAALFAVVNITAKFAWKPTDCVLLVGLFAAGSWTIVRQTSRQRGSQAAVLEPCYRGA